MEGTDFSKIKLIIWDLDETLWSGVLSEESVELFKERWEFIEDTLDCGVVHSICSKNDRDSTLEFLESIGKKDLFVFTSIDWSPKGQRVRGIVDAMSLRFPNVLFVDDNHQNLKEAEHFCEGLMVALPDEIEPLMKAARSAERTDPNHERLARYRILEEKEGLKSSFSSNEDFLMSCNIIVEMTNDVVPEIDRVHELLMRSNQLNYTKWRQDKEGLLQLVSDDSVKSGYVSVRDNFGDYGIVGFYAVKDGRLLHYFFSCRTVGMMVEQYVYMQLNCPELKVVGEVRSELNNTFLPPWINREDSCKNSSDLFNKGNETLTNTGTVLLKGPCDLGSIFQYFKSQEDIDTEFSFSNDQGVFVEGFNHIAATASAVSSDGQMREKTFDGIWWLDEGNLITRFGDTKYDVAVFSMLPTSNIGLYRSRLTGAYVGLCEKSYDLTNRKYWKAYMDGEVFSSGIPFTLEDLEHFSNVFEFVEYDYETMLAGDLQSLYDNKGRAELILMLGSELPCEKDHRFNYTNRHSEHARVNRIVEAWASDKKDVYCLHIGDHVKSEDDYTNAINHFQKKIYYSLARELVEVINGCDSVADFAVARPSDRARRKIKRIPAKVKRIFAGGK